MVAVNAVDAVKYGFRLLGYILAVSIVGFILLMVGFAMGRPTFSNPRGSPILILIFGGAGLAVIYAGGLGLLYKVIADGVETGNRSVGASPSDGNYGAGPGGQQPPAGQPQPAAQPEPQGGQGAPQGQAQQSNYGQPPQQGQGGQQPPQDWEPGN